MSQSIGKILDEFEAGKITKQQAVTKLQRNRNHAIKKAFIDSLPEKKYVDPKCTEPDFYANSEGFNDCLQTIKDNIGGNDE